jgi:alkanesulfonate monooxygenase SsuD/methylene tetrahydromethanopterin reductase-like flavin-dependent oxidoreductase (luciferase family)
MKIGIFYEHQLPRPWHEGSEAELIADALEQVELADRIGIDYVWEVEHHFLEEYSHSSAPEVFLAAASQRTRRIRLGHGIVQTPPPFNHPARVAERIAMLDLVSNGRADFGSGESSSEAELGGFGIDPEAKRAMWEEGLRVALRCLTETPFTGHEGRYVTMPPRNVVPKPVQKPHPPVWVACSRRETIHLAAQKGIGALGFAFINPEEAVHWITDYYDTLAAECVPIGDVVNPNVACVTTFMCHEDENEAIARGLEGANFFGYSLAHYYVFGRHRPGETDVWAEYREQRARQGYAPEAVEAAMTEGERLGAQIVQAEGFFGLRGAIGTPDQVRDYLRRYEEAGVDQVILCAQAGHNRHEHIIESLELLGREVLPEFIERDGPAQQQKAERLAPVLDAVMARKPPSDHPPLADDAYAFPAIPVSPAGRAVQDVFPTSLA